MLSLNHDTLNNCKENEKENIKLGIIGTHIIPQTLVYFQYR